MTLMAPQHIRGRVTAPHHSAERRAWADNHREYGHAQIAAALGISRQAVSAMLIDIEIIDDLKAGYGCDDIAVRQNIPAWKVREAISSLRRRGRIAEIYASARAEARGGASV